MDFTKKWVVDHLRNHHKQAALKYFSLCLQARFELYHELSNSTSRQRSSDSRSSNYYNEPTEIWCFNKNSHPQWPHLDRFLLVFGNPVDNFLSHVDPFLIETAILLLLNVLLLCANFEFPNGVRYLCTAMPWTVWPALVVLWEVCWMFPPPWPAPQPAFENREIHSGDYGQVPAIQTQPLAQPFIVQHTHHAPQFIPTLLDGFELDPPFAQNEVYWDEKPCGQLPDGSWFGIPQFGSDSVHNSTAPVAAPQSVHRIQGSPVRPIIPAASHTPLVSDTFQTLQTLTTAEPLTSGTSTSPKSQTEITVTSSELSCPQCKKSFSRKDVCLRHQKQQACKRMENDNATLNNIVCPHQECDRSKPGKGFKRKDNITQHLDRCKFHKKRPIGGEASTHQNSIDTAIPTGISKKRKAAEASFLDIKDDGEDSNGDRGKCPKLQLQKMRQNEKERLEEIYARLKEIEEEKAKLEKERQEHEQNLAALDPCIEKMIG